MTLSVAAREADTQADCETDSTDVDRRVDEHFARAHMCTCARAHACMHACARTSQTLPTAFPPYTTEKAYFESLKICEASIHPSRQASHSNPNPFNCSNTGSVSCHLPHLTGINFLPTFHLHPSAPRPLSQVMKSQGLMKGTLQTVLVLCRQSSSERPRSSKLDLVMTTIHLTAHRGVIGMSSGGQGAFAQPKHLPIFFFKAIGACQRYNSSLSVCLSVCLVPTGSPSSGGDVVVYVVDINQPSLPTSLYSILVSIFCLYGPFNCI